MRIDIREWTIAIVTDLATENQNPMAPADGKGKIVKRRV
jgi:hypothetical protein